MSSFINEDDLDCFGQTIPTEQKPFKPSAFYVAAQQYYREDGGRGGVPGSVDRFDKVHWTVRFFNSYFYSLIQISKYLKSFWLQYILAQNTSFVSIIISDNTYSFHF